MNRLLLYKKKTRENKEERRHSFVDMFNDDGSHCGVPQLKVGRRDTLRVDDIIIFEFTIAYKDRRQL